LVTFEGGVGAGVVGLLPPPPSHATIAAPARRMTDSVGNRFMS
jgi:hypothetical protein